VYRSCFHPPASALYWARVFVQKHGPSVVPSAGRYNHRIGPPCARHIFESQEERTPTPQLIIVVARRYLTDIIDVPDSRIRSRPKIYRNMLPPSSTHSRPTPTPDGSRVQILCYKGYIQYSFDCWEQVETIQVKACSRFDCWEDRRECDSLLSKREETITRNVTYARASTQVLIFLR